MVKNLNTILAAIRQSSSKITSLSKDDPQAIHICKKTHDSTSKSNILSRTIILIITKSFSLVEVT